MALDVAAPAPARGEPLDLGEVGLAPTGSTRVHFVWKTPTGTGINDEAPFHVSWTSSDGLASVPTSLRSVGATVQQGFDLDVVPIAGTPGGRLTGELGGVLCDTETQLVCVPVRRSIELSFRVATDKAPPPTVSISLPAAKP